MRRFCLATILGLLLMSNMGCLINQWSADPELRMEELLNTSEDLRQARLEWRRFWMIDQPSHLTPQRVHGGITPY